MNVNRAAPYVRLVRRLRAMRCYDEMLALASAVFALQMAVLLVERADAENALRLKREAIKARRELEYAVDAALEAISDNEDAGADLVANLLGGDSRTLAEILLDE